MPTELKDFDDEKISKLKSRVKEILKSNPSGVYNYNMKGRDSDNPSDYLIDWDKIGFSRHSGEKALKALRDEWEKQGKIGVKEEDVPDNPIVTRKLWIPENIGE